jgi:hypothetical protein
VCSFHSGGRSTWACAHLSVLPQMCVSCKEFCRGSFSDCSPYTRSQMIYSVNFPTWSRSSGCNDPVGMEIYNCAKYLRNVFHQVDTLILIPLYVLIHSEPSLPQIIKIPHITCTAVINERVVFEMGRTNELPNASLSPLRSVTVRFK